MFQRHYPVSVVVPRKICKIPHLQLQSPLNSKKNADQRGRVSVLGRDKSQREPNLGIMVDVPTIHSADPLIFPSHCQNTCVDRCIVLMKDDFFSFANRVFSHKFFSSSLVKRLE